jgi:large subunit ribosomal protein L30
MAEEYIAIIRIRGMTKIRKDIRDTLDMLGVSKKHAMVIRKKTPSIDGMVKKVKDFVTFGIVDKTALEKYGASSHLHPPRGGFERKGIKVPFTTGGALGNRGDKIVDLIEKMQK